MREQFLKNQIKAARKRRGLSQAALAHKLGLTAQSVTNWERNGGASPLSKRIDELQQALGCEFLPTGDTPHYLDENQAEVIDLDGPEGLISVEFLVRRVFKLTKTQRELVSRVLDIVERL